MSAASTSSAGYKMEPGALTSNFSVGDYARFFASGALCATITHGAMTPVDVVKTRIQLEPKGSKASMLSMGRQIIASEGPAGLLPALAPPQSATSSRAVPSSPATSSSRRRASTLPAATRLLSAIDRPSTSVVRPPRSSSPRPF